MSGWRAIRAESRTRRLGGAAVLALLAVLAAAGCGGATRDTIRIGFYGDCWGPFTAGFEQGTAGAELPFIRRGARPRGGRPSDGVGSVTIAGKRVELVVDLRILRLTCKRAGRGAPARRTAGGRHRRHARVRARPRRPGVPAAPARRRVHLLGTGARTHEPNLFRVAPNLRQGSAGLGAYAYHTLGWRTAVTLGEDDPLGWTLTAGFVAEFCSLGGKIVKRSWAPAVTTDWSRLVRHIPHGVDGVALMSGLISTKSFFAAYRKLQPDLPRHVVMSATAIANGDRTPGIMAAGFLPFVSAAPAWNGYIRRFPGCLPAIPRRGRRQRGLRLQRRRARAQGDPAGARRPLRW